MCQSIIFLTADFESRIWP